MFNGYTSYPYTYIYTGVWIILIPWQTPTLGFDWRFQSNQTFIRIYTGEKVSVCSRGLIGVM